MGEVRQATDLLNRARVLAEGAEFSDVERADVLFRLGVCRYKLSSIQTSIGLFNEALTLAECSGLPCDQLRSSSLGWRPRCCRPKRDVEAARRGADGALDLAAASIDPPELA